VDEQVEGVGDEQVREKDRRGVLIGWRVDAASSSSLSTTLPVRAGCSCTRLRSARVVTVMLGEEREEEEEKRRQRDRGRLKRARL